MASASIKNTIRFVVYKTALLSVSQSSLSVEKDLQDKF